MSDYNYKSDFLKNNLDLDLTDDMISKIMHANKIFKQSDMKIYDGFNRYGFLDPYNVLGGTREYIFITKPDLHLFTEGTDTLNPQLADYPFFKEARSMYKNVMLQLQKSAAGSHGPFINLISNMVTDTVELQQINADVVTTSSNYQGVKLEYRWDSYMSDNSTDFALDLKDTKYLEVYMLLKIYDEYERLKSEGLISPPNSTYTINRILHDQMAVYKIIVGEDGESIIFYAKGWGVFFKDVPRGIFNNLNDGQIKYTTTLNMSMVKDMDPMIIDDFNALVASYTGDTLPVYNQYGGHINNEWASMPYIDTSEVVTKEYSGRKPRYKLKWRKM